MNELGLMPEKNKTKISLNESDIETLSRNSCFGRLLDHCCMVSKEPRSQSCGTYNHHKQQVYTGPESHQHTKTPSME